MRQHLGPLAASISLVAGAAAATAAVAAPATQIHDAVVRVVVSPEARSDVKIDIIKANPRLPLRIWQFAGRTHLEGGLAGKIGACHMRGGQPSVFIKGLGETPYDALPQVLIHTPMAARVFVGGAVWGSVSRSASLEFSNSGCGDWVIGNVRGRMILSIEGDGGVHTGQAGTAGLYSDGSGAISTREIASGVTAITAGTGNIDMASVNGSFNVKVAGSGSVRAAGGAVSDMQAQVAGSGGVTLAGVAQTLKASILGSGDVRVTKVTGPVTKVVIGSGAVRIGS